MSLFQASRGSLLRGTALTLGYVWLGCVAFVVLEQIAALLTYRSVEVDPWRRIRFITLFYWLPWIALAPCVALISSRFPIRPADWRGPLAIHAASLVGLALLHGVVAGIVYHYSPLLTPDMATFAPWQHSGHFLFGDDVLLFDLVVYSVFAASMNIRNFHRIVEQNELDAARLNQRLTELRYETLRMQINPHFLFNALNAITVLVQKGESRNAAEMIGRLSRFFRRTLDESSSNWVELSEELEMVQEYLGIIQVRFGPRLRVVQHCDEALRAVQVPALLLQPLVENAVIHGFGNKMGDCRLEVTCRAEGRDLLRIEIKDDGAGSRLHADPEFAEGVGLANVRARLEQLYGAEHTFSLESEPGVGTQITIVLPTLPATWREAV